MGIEKKLVVFKTDVISTTQKTTALNNLLFIYMQSYGNIIQMKFMINKPIMIMILFIFVAINTHLANNIIRHNLASYQFASRL